jgi:integrase
MSLQQSCLSAKASSNTESGARSRTTTAWRAQYRGTRFFGTTKATTKREAEAVERQEREKAKQVVAQQQAARISLRIDDVFGRYWADVGQFHAGARNTERQLDYLLAALGKHTLITDITTDHVARMTARRRGDRGRGGGLVAAVTVNDTLKRLKSVFSYCKDRNVRFDDEPKWRKLFLPEPEERVRELVGDEAERLAAAAPDDLAPFFAFAAATGLRFTECRTLRWSEVDWDTRQIRRHGKGSRIVVTPITAEVRAILSHRNIRTTLRYAHVLDGEVSDALERVAESRKKSPNKSPTTLKKVG